METEEILKAIKKLKLEFYKIQCKNWIPNQGSGLGSAGRTLEMLLNKDEDQLILPDYLGIELKTKLERSEPYIGLFSMAFDNKPLEMKRLLKIGGYPDKQNPQFNVFHVSVSGNSRRKVGYRYSYQLKVDYLYQVVRLYIFNRYHQVIDWKMSWSFEQLKSRLEHKLNYLAFIPVKRWNLDGKIYYKYMRITFFKLKDFQTFLKLIEDGTIRVVFKLSYFKSGPHFGEFHDHGTSFEIKEEDLKKLFSVIDV